MTRLTQAQARMLSPLQLAYIGDAVHSMMARLHAIDRGLNVHDMHLYATRAVNAVSQARAFAALEAMLTDEEREIVKRGRNAHAHHDSPKSATHAEYAASTGLEALLGYLCLTGDDARLSQIERRLFSEDDNG